MANGQRTTVADVGNHDDDDNDSDDDDDDDRSDDDDGYNNVSVNRREKNENCVGKREQQTPTEGRKQQQEQQQRKGQLRPHHSRGFGPGERSSQGDIRGKKGTAMETEIPVCQVRNERSDVCKVRKHRK